MSELKELIDGFFRIQRFILRENPWIQKEAEPEIGNVAQIEIYDEKSAHTERLKLEKDMVIVRTNEPYVHKIRMHIDTFLLLLSGNLSFADAYTMGLIEFEGKDYHLHAMKWAQAFERLREFMYRYMPLLKFKKR